VFAAADLGEPTRPREGMVGGGAVELGMAPGHLRYLGEFLGKQEHEPAVLV